MGSYEEVESAPVIGLEKLWEAMDALEKHQNQRTVKKTNTARS